MPILTQNGREVQPGDCIVVEENFRGMSMSQWFVAVYHSVASYDNPYDVIVWMPKSGYTAGEKHNQRHAASKELAEMIAATIRREITGG